VLHRPRHAEAEIQLRLHHAPGLADLARLSGGHYDAILSAADATRVIQAVGRLEPTLAAPARHRQVREWYWVVLALAAVALVVAQGWILRRTA